ncbi:WSC domain-containing protein 1-like [Penaeus chinensis]|uniref:WSC domain-containing protein 1-like n=1 Tax=Penaeus chinensis TaxID=139456 RepID=UPI001FB664D0|nr:WSC domain-containing protein 1-like [Penaeus chinensis]XP_047470072.1 WSC domain-containing protein 1-like [Penaeus chinensis]XP_047470073.1 WSC domain-containing protein 1-like [Penaeus chinensis]
MARLSAMRSCFFLAPWTKRRSSRMAFFLAIFLASFLGLCILKVLHPAPGERVSFARAHLRQVLDSLQNEALLQDEGGEVEDEGNGAEGGRGQEQEDEKADNGDQKEMDEEDEGGQRQDEADKGEEEGGQEDERYQEEDEEDQGEVEGYQKDEGDQDEGRGDEDGNEGLGKTDENDFERDDLPLGKTGLPEEKSYRDIKLDFRRSSRRLWPNDDDEFCSRMEVRFAVGMTSSILHSFPRSGNTWMRYLIEAASGVFTGSCYNDKTLIRSGFKGERDSIYWKTTIVTKAHFAKHVGKYKYRPTVIIIRNPARVIISLWSYARIRNRKKRHTKTVSETTLDNEKFRAFVRYQLDKWLHTTLFALKKCRDAFPVFYEIVREDPVGETRRILEFLKVKPPEDRLACMARHVRGNVKGAQKSLDPYTEEEKELFLQALKEVNEALIRRGFPTLPDYSKYKN